MSHSSEGTTCSRPLGSTPPVIAKAIRTWVMLDEKKLASFRAPESAVHVAQINYVYDARLRDPDALLERYATLTGWSQALLSGGASRSTVVQRFHGDADFSRNGVRYLFVKDRNTERPRLWRGVRRLHQAVALVDPDLVHVNGLSFPLEMQ